MQTGRGPLRSGPVLCVGATLVGLEYRKNPKANLTRQRGLLRSLTRLVAKITQLEFDTQQDSVNES